MTKEFIDAFVWAYGCSVADHTEEEVRAFLEDIDSNEDLHTKHECYTSVMDALGMFQAGIKYCEQFDKNK